MESWSILERVKTLKLYPDSNHAGNFLVFLQCSVWNVDKWSFLRAKLTQTSHFNTFNFIIIILALSHLSYKNENRKMRMVHINRRCNEHRKKCIYQKEDKINRC